MIGVRFHPRDTTNQQTSRFKLKFLIQLRTEWIIWWQTRHPLRRVWPLLAISLFGFSHLLLGGLKSDHLVLLAPLFVFAYGGPRLTRLAQFFLPILLVGIVYDFQRYYVDALRAPIQIQQPYELELSLFSIDGQTPAAWFQTRTNVVLDCLTGIAYITFIPVYIGIAAWFHWKPPFIQREDSLQARYQATGLCMMWGLLAINLLGYVTYLIYPAAPPWYVDLYGFTLVENAPPDPAGTLRFDELIGIPVFQNYYSKSTNVFGAIPSLHCGQTFLIVLLCFCAQSLRTFATVFFLLVLFGSVYLNHHYLIDGLIGMAYAIFVAAFCAAYIRKTRQNTQIQ